MSVRVSLCVCGGNEHNGEWRAPRYGGSQKVVSEVRVVVLRTGLDRPLGLEHDQL